MNGFAFFAMVTTVNVLIAMCLIADLRRRVSALERERKEGV